MYLDFQMTGNDNTPVTARVFVDDAAAAAFSASYYPLNNTTADVFISSFSKEHKARLSCLMEALSTSQSPEHESDEISAIFQAELAHSASLVHECGN